MTAAAELTGKSDPAATLSDRERIAYLDGWRAISVALVIAAHVLANVLDVQARWLAFLGPTGVYIFFLISGYIISALAVAEIRQTGTFSQSKFILRRVLRILPPLWLYLAVALALHAVTGLDLASAVRGLLFTCNFEIAGSTCGWSAGHTWSLAFEEQFYLLFPFLVLRRFRLWVLPILAFALLPAVVPVNFIGRVGQLQIWTLFGLGAATAVYETRVRQLLVKLTPWLILPAIAGVIVAYLVPLSPIRTLLQLLIPAALMVLVFGLVWSAPAVRKVLELKPLRQIGLYSYSIYLWQQMFFPPKGNQGPVYALLAVACVIGLSAISYHTYEKVFRRLSRRFGHPAYAAQANGGGR